MSIHRWNIAISKLHGVLVRDAGGLARFFSRRSVPSSDEGPYKVVKSRKVKKNDTSLAWRDPDYDLLASKCFPFFMPGNVGPAWYDRDTTLRNDSAFVMEAVKENHGSSDILCKIQPCPTVLRKSVSDLFPDRNLEHVDLSVVTITIKPDLKLLRQNNELETEKLAQAFVLIAKNVCGKLRRAGYWADFVNPFSGRPYFSSSEVNGGELYDTDEKFRCLGFQIYEISKCMVVSNEENCGKRNFIGSLFTNAPSQKNHLDEVFSK